MTDEHEYRKAIADDCIVGICSANNCLYPDCSPSALKAEVQPLPTSEWDVPPMPTIPVIGIYLMSVMVAIVVGVIMMVFRS